MAEPGRVEAQRETTAADRLRIGLAVGATTLPPLADLAWNGWSRVFGYFAADAFTYLTVARNLARGHGLSFDQQHATNGFHPLWQLTSAGLYAFCDVLGLPEPVFLVATFALCLALLGVAVALLGRSFQLATGRVPPAFPLLPLGLYPLCAGAFAPRFGSLWSYANGMESALLLAASAGALWAALQLERGARRPAWLGVALAVVLLARLDHGALALCALLALAPRGARTVAEAGAPFALALAAYLAFNLASAGTLLPVSGALKSSFPDAARQNLHYLERILWAPTAAHPGELWRMAQMLLPAIPAALLLPWLATLRRRGRADALTGPLAVGAVFVGVLAGYDFLCVGLWHQGHWYYPVSTLWMTLAALYLWEKERPLAGARALRLAPALASAAALAWFAGVFPDASAGAHYRALYLARGEIVAHFGARPPRLVEYDDGIVGFATGFPALSGLGFGVDREALPWLRRGRLLWLAYERGYDHLASLNYLDARGLSPASSSDEIRAVLDRSFFLSPEATAPFDFRVVHVPARANLAFIRLELRRCPPEPAFSACGSAPLASEGARASGPRPPAG